MSKSTHNICIIIKNTYHILVNTKFRSENATDFSVTEAYLTTFIYRETNDFVEQVCKTTNPMGGLFAFTFSL